MASADGMHPLAVASDSEEVAETHVSSSCLRGRYRLVAAATTMVAASVAMLVFAHAHPLSQLRGGGLPLTAETDALLNEDEERDVEPFTMTITMLSPGRDQSMKPLDHIGNCAVIGSAPNTEGKGYGSTIDGHDTVIRVNRLPRLMDQVDLGKKTDVITMNNMFMLYDHVSGTFSPSTWAAYIGGVVVDCHTPGVCDFDSLVFQHAKGAPDIVWDVIGSENYWGSMRQTVGRESDDFYEALECLNWPEKMILSGGFETVMMFLPLCQTLKTYGFGGSGSIDSHGVDPRHNFELEHVLMKKMTDGKVSASDFLNTTTCKESKSRMLAWMRKNLHKLAGRFSMQL